MLEEQSADWLTAMKVKTTLDQRRRKPMMQGAGRTSVAAAARARHVTNVCISLVSFAQKSLLQFPPRCQLAPPSNDLHLVDTQASRAGGHCGLETQTKPTKHDECEADQDGAAARV